MYIRKHFLFGLILEDSAKSDLYLTHMVKDQKMCLKIKPSINYG